MHASQSLRKALFCTMCTLSILSFPLELFIVLSFNHEKLEQLKEKLYDCFGNLHPPLKPNESGNFDQDVMRIVKEQHIVIILGDIGEEFSDNITMDVNSGRNWITTLLSSPAFPKAKLRHVFLVRFGTRSVITGFMDKLQQIPVPEHPSDDSFDPVYVAKLIHERTKHQFENQRILQRSERSSTSTLGSSAIASSQLTYENITLNRLANPVMLEYPWSYKSYENLPVTTTIKGGKAERGDEDYEKEVWNNTTASQTEMEISSMKALKDVHVVLKEESKPARHNIMIEQEGWDMDGSLKKTVSSDYWSSLNTDSNVTGSLGKLKLLDKHTKAPKHQIEFENQRKLQPPERSSTSTLGSSREVASTRHAEGTQQNNTKPLADEKEDPVADLIMLGSLCDDQELAATTTVNSLP